MASSPPANPWPVRIGLALVVAVYLGYSSFGFAHPVLWGHYGHHTAEYFLRALTSLRFHMVAPATSAGYEPPLRQFYYFHHPIGYHHLYTLLIALFGNHHWLGAVAPALTGLLVIAALFALVRRWWSREAALLAVAVWVGLPFVCSFSILTDAMFPEMACCLVLVNAFLRYLELPSRRALRTACIVIVVGGLLMWEVYFQALLHGLHALAWWAATARGRRERLGRWPAAWAWIVATGATAAATMAFHFGFLWSRGMWDDFRASYAQRRGALVSWVIERHELWLKILYGWPLVALGLLWLALFAVRAATGRARHRDTAVLLFFVINVLYIALFSAASSVHLYRVFFFSSFLALAVTDLSVDLHAVAAHRLGRRGAHALVAAALALYFAVETPHAYANLLESRVMMGAHATPGYNADYPKMLFAAEVARRTGPDDFVWVHDNLPRRVEFYYYVDRSNGIFSSLSQLPALTSTHPRNVVLMDAGVSGAERRLLLELLAKHPAWQWDHYLFIDLRSNVPGFHEYVFEPERPSWAWRFFVSHHYPPMRAREVPSAMASCVAAVAHVAPARGSPAPVEPPLAKTDLLQCHYDDLVLRGEAARARAFLAKVVASGAARDVPLAPFGRVVALTGVSRAAAGVWILVDEPAPRGLWFRWRLTPVRAGKGARTLTGEAPPTADWMLPEELHPGDLYNERTAWSAPPGTYRLQLELAPPDLRGGARRPPPAPFASADLGEVTLR